MSQTPEDPRPDTPVRYVGARHPLISPGDEARIVRVDRPGAMVISRRGFHIHVSSRDLQPVAANDAVARESAPNGAASPADAR